MSLRRDWKRRSERMSEKDSINSVFLKRKRLDVEPSKKKQIGKRK